MGLIARVDTNCEQKTDGQMDRWKNGCLYHTLLKQVRQKHFLTGKNTISPVLNLGSFIIIYVFILFGFFFSNLKSMKISKVFISDFSR